jgi:hypothetical protein
LKVSQVAAQQKGISRQGDAGDAQVERPDPNPLFPEGNELILGGLVERQHGDLQSGDDCREQTVVGLQEKVGTAVPIDLRQPTLEMLLKRDDRRAHFIPGKLTESVHQAVALRLQTLL